MSDEVLYEVVEGGIAVVTLNRPQKRNAITPAMARALADAVQNTERDPSVRVVILTSSSDQAFCAGADLAATAAGAGPGASLPEGGFAAFHREMFNKNYDFAKALIDSGLVLPALDYCLKCSHLFNLLDSSGSIGVTERTAYILRVRQLAVAIAKVWAETSVAEDAVHGS